MYILPAVHTTKVEIAGGANPKAEEVMSAAGAARANRANVIEGAQSVERLLETVIVNHFIPAGGVLADQFRSLVVETDTCSYAVKKRLAMIIAREMNLLAGEKLNRHDKLLSDAMRYRNAFTHGSLSSDGKSVWLSYFEGGPKKIELTDDYLRKIEVALSRAFHETRECFKLG